MYDLEVVERVLEQGILWDKLFSAILAMKLEYHEDYVHNKIYNTLCRRLT